ncbi:MULTISPECIES: hypothetical protein [Nocardia]|uniref:hypothetical protein n=1 Tax=Nocardia TaxID=1817 RepID=UPI0002DE6823|nr:MULTISPECIES: hypothetical protein [Nocardia]
MDSVLLTLAVLACPIGMGAMMFMMMRGNRHDSGDDTRQIELDTLRAEIEHLKADRQAEHRPGNSS